MAVEFICNSLCVARFVKQQIADEIGAAVGTLLDISNCQIQVVPQLSIGREILINTSHGDFTRQFHILGIRLQQLAKRRLPREQVLSQRPGNNHRIGPFQCVRISLNHLDAEDIDEPLRDEEKLPLVTRRSLAFLCCGEIYLPHERHHRASRLDMGR